MARGDKKTVQAYADADTYHEKRKRAAVAAGTHIWMFNAAGLPTAIRDDPDVIKKKLRQGYTMADVVEETITRPVFRRADAEPAAAEAPKPKRGPGRPKKAETKDGE
jgi:hypothetical protein